VHTPAPDRPEFARQRKDVEHLAPAVGAVLVASRSNRRRLGSGTNRVQLESVRRLCAADNQNHDIEGAASEFTLGRVLERTQRQWPSQVSLAEPSNRDSDRLGDGQGQSVPVFITRRQHSPPPSIASHRRPPMTALANLSVVTVCGEDRLGGGTSFFTCVWPGNCPGSLTSRAAWYHRLGDVCLTPTLTASIVCLSRPLPQHGGLLFSSEELGVRHGADSSFSRSVRRAAPHPWRLTRVRPRRAASAIR